MAHIVVRHRFQPPLTGETMKRPLNRIERFIRILKIHGRKPAAAYAMRHGLSCEGCTAAMRGARHA